MILWNCRWLSGSFMFFPSTDKRRFLQGYYFEEIPRSASGLNTANTKTDERVLAHFSQIHRDSLVAVYHERYVSDERFNGLHVHRTLCFGFLSVETTKQ